MKRVVIVGATSAIAKEYARLIVSSETSYVLFGRDLSKLQDLEKDLKVRGAKNVYARQFDASNPATAKLDINSAKAMLGRIDEALIAHGVLPDQADCEVSYESAAKSFAVNLLSPIAYVTALLEEFNSMGSGSIAVITSVAGDRGRKSNFVYGAAKASLSTYLAGLRHKYGRNRSIHILDIKPGFVDTPMTSHLKRGPLFASPERVARDILNAVKNRRGVVYTPWFWRWIMFIIRHVPESIFNKTNV